MGSKSLPCKESQHHQKQGLVTVQILWISSKTIKFPAYLLKAVVNPKAIQEVAREAKVTIGKPLFSDALGSPSDTIIGPDGEVHSLASWSGNDDL